MSMRKTTRRPSKFTTPCSFRFPFFFLFLPNPLHLIHICLTCTSDRKTSTFHCNRFTLSISTPLHLIENRLNSNLPALRKHFRSRSRSRSPSAIIRRPTRQRDVAADHPQPRQRRQPTSDSDSPTDPASDNDSENLLNTFSPVPYRKDKT